MNSSTLQREPAVEAGREKPLTDPTELMTLLGRFGACAALLVVTVAAFVKQNLPLGLVLALVSLIVQRATVKLYRRLRDERITAEADRAARNGSTAS
jgi:hypothetical protein